MQTSALRASALRARAPSKLGFRPRHKPRSRQRRSAMPHDDSESSSSSSSDDEKGRRERKEKRKKEKKEKKKSKHKSKSKKHKKDKKSRKEKKSKHKSNSSHSSASRGSVFGKYGILGPQDRYHKQQEFYLWLREVKEIEPENQPPSELATLFEDFAEDYNTVTLPHKKYYNLEGWEAKQAKKRPADDDGAAAAAPAASIIDDERALAARNVKKSRMGMSKEELLEMRRIMQERAEAAVKKDLGMKVDDKAGVRTQSMMRGLVQKGTKTI